MYDTNDVKRFARNALAGMADNLAGAAEEDGREMMIGDHTEAVREEALVFAQDMLTDFAAEVLREIRETKFTAIVDMRVDFSK